MAHPRAEPGVLRTSVSSGITSVLPFIGMKGNNDSQMRWQSPVVSWGWVSGSGALPSTSCQESRQKAGQRERFGQVFPSARHQPNGERHIRGGPPFWVRNISPLLMSLCPFLVCIWLACSLVAPGHPFALMDDHQRLYVIRPSQLCGHRGKFQCRRVGDANLCAWSPDPAEPRSVSWSTVVHHQKVHQARGEPALALFTMDDYTCKQVR